MSGMDETCTGVSLLGWGEGRRSRAGGPGDGRCAFGPAQFECLQARPVETAGYCSGGERTASRAEIQSCSVDELLEGVSDSWMLPMTYQQRQHRWLCHDLEDLFESFRSPGPEGSRISGIISLHSDHFIIQSCFTKSVEPRLGVGGKEVLCALYPLVPRVGLGSATSASLGTFQKCKLFAPLRSTDSESAFWQTPK